MTVVTITKIAGDSGAGLVLEIRNVQSLTSEYETNSVLFPLPQLPPTEAIAMNVAGSSIRYHITYTLNQEDTTVVAGLTIQSPDQQHAFLTGLDGNGFPPVVFGDIYQLDLGFGIPINGMISSISFTKNEGQTVWSCTINFDVGQGVA